MNKSNSFSSEGSTNRHAYAIAAIFPGCQPKTISRTPNRSDAEEMVRFLQQKIPNGTFHIILQREESKETPIA
jgi:hypothetical protein